MVKYNGQVIVYDTEDGYNCENEIVWYYNHCDHYFKRSFSAEKNERLGFSPSKIHPLGLYRYITYPWNPIQGSKYKWLVKFALNRNLDYKVVGPHSLEENPCWKNTEDLRILFSVRLWAEDAKLSNELNEERASINRMRIEIIRALRERYPNSFIGGLEDSKLARELAPDLILSRSFTTRKNYFTILSQCDICIGTMGLHESIGGKIAEYVTASKAIVTERLRYVLPGPFDEGRNYLSFSSVEECLFCVDSLMSNPQAVLEMKRENQQYYQEWLRPDSLIRQSLKVVF